MPSPAHENASPSASSLFLPLGKRVRRDSRSSLSTELDQDALNEALNTIHTAASQSQVLTVFNEYTDPPPATSKTDTRTLAADLQGGISGLYNKIKATVVSQKENGEPQDASTSLSFSHDNSTSRLSSGRTSKVHSPKIYASEGQSNVEPLPQSSRVSSKATSVSKSSAPITPLLKSPAGPSQPASHLADPTVTEINIHATNSSATHSRNASGFDTSDVSNTDFSTPPAHDGESLRRVLSRNGNEASDNTRAERRLVSPDSQPTQRSANRTLLVSHERGMSETSIRSQLSNVTTNGEERPLGRILSHKPETPGPSMHSSNPLSLLGDGNGHLAKSSVVSPGGTADVKIKSPTISTTENRSRERLPPRISQSRLPGFTSRASSTDSSLVTALSKSKRSVQEGTVDGTDDTSEIQSTASKPLSKLRSKLLSREFWMRDENARDCFHCGEPFTTFRRKHHCRTCGQIFDNKCTILVNGTHFGSVGAVRVCKPCEATIISHDDSSSDYSVEDGPPVDSNTRPQTPDPAQLLRNTPRFDDDNVSIMSQSLEQMAKTPTMSFPVRRAFEGNNKSSAILEFETMDRPIPRPSSSRSLKSGHSMGHGHKRHHSRHQHIRNYKAYHEDRVPFQRRTAEELPKEYKPSAFHRDSIIDPDLAQYLSDDASSGDDQSMNISLDHDKLSRTDHDRSTIGGLLAAVRKGKSRIGDRSIAGFLNLGRDGDDVSVVSSRALDGVRSSRKRNLSVASSSRQKLTPKALKERLQITIPNPEASQTGSKQSPEQTRSSRMIRSASMHGLGAPSIELNRASIQHVHKLLQQLLKDAELTKVASWEEALVPILLRATDDVDPDVQGGDDIDIRNYVKLKKIPGGKPGDTAYISGLIFTKNVALKSMSRLVMNPRILIITFPIEYARHEQHFMSLDPVIRQEKEYLENMVGRIAALKPDVLLAQRNISGLALELLDKAQIATIFNVKSSVLEAVSRCTQTRVAHSIDKLTLQSSQLGTCDSFEVKTFVSDGRKKTYIYLSGCAPQLGCTIALRGADRKLLSKIKRITEFMVYVVYNLKLETCLMRDEWALIPTAPKEKSGSDNNGTPKTGQTQSSQPTTSIKSARTSLENDELHMKSKGDAQNVDLQSKENQPQIISSDSNEAANIPDDIPIPTFYKDLVDKHETKILSASPFVKFIQPYLLMRARELERRVTYLKRLRDQDLSSERMSDDKNKVQKFTLIQPEMVHSSQPSASGKVREIIHAVHDAEYDKALHNYDTQKKQWEAYLSGNRNLFDPYAHQNIVVLFSLVSTSTSVPCSGPDLLAFSFYNEHEQEEEFEADCTLGQYVEDLCYRAHDTCPSETCEKKMYEHHRQYVHGEAQITVFVQPYPAKMRGLEDVILMWSQCKICGVETTVTPMSTSTWKYSFGKYLELSFWSADLHARAGICPHDLHRDHLRYFGYKDLALRVHYDPIDLLEIIVPRMRITWKVDNDLKFRNEVFTRLEQRITRFMVSVKLRLKSINIEALIPDNSEACQAEIDLLVKKANEEHTALIKQLQERYSNSRHWEIIPLNRAVRATQEKVAEWDTVFSEFEQNYFPSEKDIRRLATLQLKKIFLDRDVSVTSLTSTDGGTVSSIDTSQTEKTPTLSPEKTQNVLQSVLEAHVQGENTETETTQQPSNGVVDEKQVANVLNESRSPESVRHLDLAMPSPRLPIPRSENNETSAPELKVVASSPDNTNILVASPPTPVPIPANNATDDQEIPSTQPLASPDINTHPPSFERSMTTAFRRSGDRKSTAPALLRAHSQPANSAALRREASQGSTSTMSAINATHGFGSAQMQNLMPTSAVEPDTTVNGGEKKLSDRLGLGHIKNSKFVKGHSFIPRAINSKKDSRVSNLAKHFEQLSREFERERIKERRQRAAKSRQSRVYPLAASKAIVEVYKDVAAAVDEKNGSDDIFDLHDGRVVNDSETANTPESLAQIEQSKTPVPEFHAEEQAADTTENETDRHGSSHAPSENDDVSDTDEHDEVVEEIHLPDSPEELLRLSQEDLDLKELPKHEQTSLMKMLTNFWAERSSSGWAPLEYPLGATDHIFADCDIIVREDEPSSIIAFALDSEDYKSMLHDIQQRPGPTNAGDLGLDPNDLQADVMHSLLRKTGTHLKYQFQEGPAKLLCKIFFAEQFDAVRRKCGVADRIVESLSRCMKWDSKGGKTKSLFLKTLDDRFILKSLSPIETQSFLKFAPNYFQIMSEAFFHELPSVIAKMLGFYQIIAKNPVTGVEYNWYLLVMENLFYDRTPDRIFDLKGSMRNRKINATGEQNEVLLDENMVEFIYESPLFTREHSKKLLRSSVHNDTLFLARQNVMDYSLMVAIDEKRKELVVGIIDCIRTYTWDKKLESWIKDRGFAGGGKNRPTVTSPKEYKRRFREAMGRYVLEAPNCWYQIRPQRVERKILKGDVDKDGEKGENELHIIA